MNAILVTYQAKSDERLIWPTLFMYVLYPVGTYHGMANTITFHIYIISFFTNTKVYYYIMEL